MLLRGLNVTYIYQHICRDGYQVSYSLKLFYFVVGEYSTKPPLSRTLAKVMTEKESVA